MSADSFSSPHAAFGAAVAAGLSATPKAISPKWLYDPLGAKLFDAITELPEYYPTRTEIALFEAVMPQAVAGLGAEVAVVELGAGSAVKTPLLLEALDRPSIYAPIDIAGPALHAGAKIIQERFPTLQVQPLEADFTGAWRAPATRGRPLGFFPGSTIGNFEPGAAVSLLRHARQALGERGAMLVGVDTPKDEGVLIAAYDDALGVTAAFNANLLVRINRDLGGSIDIESFSHEARWNPAESRIEMHLVSLRAQRVLTAVGAFSFDAGETIHTESSYKWSPEGFQALAARAGWRSAGLWLAPGGAFALHRLEA
jgi:dimethylhistidine N-methyltransferase